MHCRSSFVCEQRRVVLSNIQGLVCLVGLEASNNDFYVFHLPKFGLCDRRTMMELPQVLTKAWSEAE